MHAVMLASMKLITPPTHDVAYSLQTCTATVHVSKIILND